jgi:hypothetical protein
MTVLTPCHDNTSEHQAGTATADLQKHQRKVLADEAKRQADPLGDGTKLASWQAPAAWGAITERVPCRRRGIPAERLRYANHDDWVYRLTVRLHGFDG